MTQAQANQLIAAIQRLGNLLEQLIDSNKNALRMFDTERATVYKTHLGSKLSEPITVGAGDPAEDSL